MPPRDILKELIAALTFAALSDDELDPKKVFAECVGVSGEWEFKEYLPLHDCFRQRYIKERSVPMKHQTLEETLSPQPVASRVLMRLLAWIDSVDVASQDGSSRPAFLGEDGLPIFPAADSPDERWWLTELSRRKEDERLLKDLEECIGSSEEDLSDEAAGEIVADKKPGDETCGEESDDMEDTPASSSSQSGALLPLQRSQYSSRKSYEETPLSQQAFR